MEYTIKVGELVDRPIIRNDQQNEWMNKMTDNEIHKMFSEIYQMLDNENVPNQYPEWNAELLAKIIDRDILYNLFKEGINRAKDRKPIFIGLTRLDLQKHKEDLPIDDIDLFSFKSSSLSHDDINKADFVAFVDDNKMKELKNRYATWPLNK